MWRTRFSLRSGFVGELLSVSTPQVTVNVVSESAFTAKGHGVHSSFVDSLDALRAVPGLDVVANSTRQTDVTHLHTVGPASVLALARAKSSVVTAHITVDSLAGSVVGGHLLAPLWHCYLRWFYNRADVVLSLNRWQESELRRDGVVSEIVVLKPGIHRLALPSRAQARAQLGFGDDEQIVLSVGQVQPRKAVMAFRRAATDLPQAHFVWVGGFPFGPLTAHYRRMRGLVRRAPNNVTHVGQLRRSTVQLYLAAADVYFHPSWQEHAPVAVFEAAAAGLPLVLRDIECYRHLYPGRYLPATDASFSTQIGRLLTEPELYRKMATRSEAIAHIYSSSHAAADLAALYKRLDSQRRTGSSSAPGGSRWPSRSMQPE